MDRTQRLSQTIACALAVIATAWAADACAQRVRAAPTFRLATPAPIAVLLCELQPRPFGPGLVKVTNVGAAPVAAGRPIVITYVQPGAAGPDFGNLAAAPGGAGAAPVSGGQAPANGSVVGAGRYGAFATHLIVASRRRRRPILDGQVACSCSPRLT